MNILRRLFFQIWYFRNPPWDTNRTPPEVLEFIASHPPGRALDLGCGTGTNVITLARHGWNTIGIDFVPKAIRLARKKAALEGIQADFYVDDVTQLKGDFEAFDLVLDMGCFHSLDSKSLASYRENLKRLLAPGGSFLLYIFFRDEDKPTGSGIVEADLEPFSDFLDLVNRQEGTERGIRKSLWLTYCKPLS